MGPGIDIFNTKTWLYYEAKVNYVTGSETMILPELGTMTMGDYDVPEAEHYE